MKKRLISALILITLLLSINVFAIETNIDVTPPTGTISITSATLTNGINYVGERTVEVNVTASSDTTKVYVTNSANFNTEKIQENQWETYTSGYKKQVIFPSGQTIMTIYVVLKDARGNTSTIFKEVNTQYNVVYNANGGTNAPETQIGYFGMPFKVTMNRPTYNGKYFMGWSTNSGADEPTFIQGSTIPAETFVGDNKNITLYAVWADTIPELPLLSERVEVGDYVNYPVYYENVTGVDTSTLTGWRVLSKDVDLEGNTSIGTVNLISAGTPLTYYPTTASTSITNLTDNFLTTTIKSTGTNMYRKNGFTTYANLTEIFNNKYTSLNGTTPIVRSIKDSDILEVTEENSISVGTTMGLSDEKYQNIFANGSTYWVASQGSTALRYIKEGNISENNRQEYGVRPVVSLKNTVATTGVNNLGTWDIEVLASAGEDEINAYTITFDGNGGTPATQTKTIIEGRTYGTLPAVTRAGYTFLGWYTELTEGTKITETTTIIRNEAHTIYAHWEIAVAIYSEDDYSLRFYKASEIPTAGSDYEGRTVTYVYTGFDKTDYSLASTVPWYGIRSLVKTVSVENVIAPTSTAYWFYEFTNSTTFNVQKIENSNLISTKYMFYKAGYDSNDLSITGCSSWNPRQLKDTSYMFSHAGYNSSSFSIDGFYNWFYGTSIEDMSYMFESAGANANTWSIGTTSTMDTSNVTNMSHMFYNAGQNAKQLISLDLSSFNTKKATSMTNMFTGMNMLSQIELGADFSFNGSGTTRKCNLPTPNSTYITGADGYWYNVSTSMDYTPETVPNETAATYTAIAPTKIAYAVYSSGDNSLSFYKTARTLAAGDTYNGKVITNVYTGFEDADYTTASSVPWYNIRESITSVYVVDEITPTSMAYWFYGFANTETFDIANIDTTNVKKMTYTFGYAGQNVTNFSLDLSNWNTENVTSMAYMFYYVAQGSSTVSINFSEKWTTKKVENMRYMFSNTGYKVSRRL